MKIKGHVVATLRDKNGNVVQRVEGPNAVVEMSNNILMDVIYPKLGTSVSPVAFTTSRAQGANMTADTTYPTGSNYIGHNLGGSPKADFAKNHIAYLALGSNLGQDSAGNAHASQNADVGSPNEQVSMVDQSFDLTSSDYAVQIQIVEFPAYNQMRFSTTFATTEGNVPDGVAEIALWTLGSNADLDGFVQDCSSTTGCRMFARKVLATTINKTTDGTLDITYTLTFGA